MRPCEDSLLQSMARQRRALMRSVSPGLAVQLTWFRMNRLWRKARQPETLLPQPPLAVAWKMTLYTPENGLRSI